MKPQALTQNRAYSEFTHARDRALEKILHVHLSAIDVVLGKLKRKVLSLAHLSPALVSREFELATAQIAEIAIRLRKASRILAHSSEAYAVAGIYGETPKERQTPPKDDMPSGGKVYARIGLAMSRLQRKLADAIQLSNTLEETHQEAMVRLAKAFPPDRGKPTITPALSRRRLTREANRIQAGIYDTDTWDEILEDYKADQLPDSIFGRGPNDDVLFYDVDSREFEVRYQWEVEQEITEDFVTQVREGTHEAAQENGITDFQWVAIIDSHTDECCSVRDGLTSQEIEDKLSTGDIDDDVCDAIVAPAHFNCRCKSVPMDENVPDQAPPDFQSFDDWLDDKAAA